VRQNYNEDYKKLLLFTGGS